MTITTGGTTYNTGNNLGAWTLNLTFTPQSTFQLTGGIPTPVTVIFDVAGNFSMANSSGTVVLDNITSTLTAAIRGVAFPGLAGATGNTALVDVSGVFAAPEPATFGFAALALLAMVWWRVVKTV
jgi:hypothetical protein